MFKHFWGVLASVDFWQSWWLCICAHHGMQEKPCKAQPTRRSSPEQGWRGQSPLCYLLHVCATGVKVHQKLIWRVAPAQTLGSTSKFRTETLFVCPFIPWHGWLFVRQMYAACKSFPNLSAPPPSMHSAHTLTPQQMFQEEVFLTVCILLTTILLQAINVFSCPSTLLVRKQSKTNKKIHHFPNNWTP